MTENGGPGVLMGSAGDTTGDGDYSANGTRTPAPSNLDLTGASLANGAEHTKYLAYPQTHLLSSSQATYDANTGTITMRIPRSLVGNPSDGTALFSINAFSATSSSAQSSTTLFNRIDATPTFELVVGPPGTVGTLPSLGGAGGSRSACSAAVGRLTGRALGRVRLGVTRRRAREQFPHWSTRGRHDDMDFYFVCPKGIRAGYPSPVLLRALPRRERRAVQGRVVLLLTANKHYALHGVRAGVRLARVARRLHVGRGFKIGVNTWYPVPNGPSRGVLKVRHGVILEIGIADKRLTAGSAAAVRFFKVFR